MIPLRRALPALLALAACHAHPGPSDGGPRDAGLDGGAALTGLEAVPLQSTFTAPGLSSPVDVVRDSHGVPHIYGQSLPDIAYAQGYVVAHDRLIQMDFARHEADGTLSSLIGLASPGIVASDAQMRLHHLRDQAQAELAALTASPDPNDALLVRALSRFADGVNAYAADLSAGKWSLPIEYAPVYQPPSFTTWTPVDSLLLGELFAFELSFDASDVLNATALADEGAARFDDGGTADLRARAGIGEDLQLHAPVDATFTIPGWTGMNGDSSTARRARRLPGRPSPRLLREDRAALAALQAEDRGRQRGSNNWIVGPALSQSGHVLIANDTHLAIDNPATFWLVHLVDRGADVPLDVMGEQFAGVPLVTLGMNRHAAWAATVSNIDVTSVYAETIVPCASQPGSSCAVFNGAQVPLVPRQETFSLGYLGTQSGSVALTFYEVPEHGPIIPRLTYDSTGHVTGTAPLGAEELSIRYTGYQAGMLVKAIFGLDRAGSMQEAVAALDQSFDYGGQNWVIGDDQGQIGWSEIERVPRRAPPRPGAPNLPWQVLPGDGTAEWGANMDPRFIPHAYDPARGFLATSNNDPIGVTAQNDPFLGQPELDGGPLYLGAFYDPGTRIGRTTKRLQAAADGGAKLTLDDMQSIQADAVTEWGQGFAPTFLDAAEALLAEAAALDGGADGGPYPELAPLLSPEPVAADGGVVDAGPADGGAVDGGGRDGGGDGGPAIVLPAPLALVQAAHDLVAGWSFDTPSGVSATGSELTDSQATLVMAEFVSHLAHDTLDDELAVFDQAQVSVDELQEEKLLYFLCQTPLSPLLKTGVSPVTGDSILFDDLRTPGVVESKRFIAARAIEEGLRDAAAKLGPDPAAWTWGALHTVHFGFFLGPGVADALNLPPPHDKAFPNGYPRHGDNGTVDVAPRGLSTSSFAQEDLGPAIRFVAELDPVNGPTARNALPGGEIFDPTSPHYDDQLQLWLQNQTFDLAYHDADVVREGLAEQQQNGIGRWRFAP
ncbi:MAG: penicillin acylase family protein [Deltaproteobacteria bacterium]